MTDRRELILARLLEIARGIDGIVSAFRNKDEISEKQRPCIVILDADEAADDADPTSRPKRSPRRVAMTPEIYILLGSKPEDLGTAINALRARLLSAVLTDDQLIGLVGSNGDIRYEGCATALARGRSMEGEMGVSLSFTYVLRMEEL
jgi:hypothetical protein